jgi:protein-tyrosine phosphatase
MGQICWISGKPSTTLAVVLCPRGEGRLRQELGELKNGGIDAVVSLLEPDEAEWLGLDEEEQVAKELGMQFLPFPIPDTQVPPDPIAFGEFITGLVNRLRHGEHIGVHCRGSIGRATVTAAAVLIRLGWKPEKALEAIEDARGCSVPDTPEQRAWILNYEQQG